MASHEMIERWTLPFDFGGPELGRDRAGEWVKYDDHRRALEAALPQGSAKVAEVERERDAAEQAEWATKDWFWSIANKYIEHFGMPDFPDPDLSVNWKARASELQREVERLRAQLAESDRHAEKIEALLDPHIDWKDS